MKRSVVLCIVALVLLLVPNAASAADEPLSPAALEIANALNCPVCQGESVRDSNSELSHQIRQIIQQKLDQGESRQQIMDYFVARYGTTILREPPKSGMVLALWWVPVVALLVGALIVVSFVFQRQRRDTAAGDASADDRELVVYEERLRRELET